MRLNRNIEEVKMDLQVSPLIDVVFLLLIYFIVTTDLLNIERDISWILPARTPPDVQVELPVEVIIKIAADGTVEMGGILFPPEDIVLQELANQVREQKAVAKSQNAVFFVNLLPTKSTLHSRIINVMDACAAAEVKNLSFSASIE